MINYFLKNLLILMAWLSLFVIYAVSADSKDQSIMIVNSNVKVEKYKKAQLSFKKYASNNNFSGEVSELNLSDDRIDSSVIKIQLLKTKPDIIYCIGSKSLDMVQKLISNKPIIFSSIINWKRLDLNNNVYGVANELPVLTQLSNYRYLFPKLKNLGFIYSKRYNKELVDDYKRVSKNMGFNIIDKAIDNPKDLTNLLQEISANIDAFVLVADPLILINENNIVKIFKFFDKKQIPVFAYNNFFNQYGATLITSVDIKTIGIQAASLANDLLQSKNTEKVLPPIGSYIGLDLQKVKHYGLEFNEDALPSINEFLK